MAAALGKYISALTQRVQDVVWSTNILQSAFGVLGVVMQHMIRHPCEVIYRNAPGAVGGWEGRDSADVCAQLTGTKASFWEGENMTECLSMIERRFESWFTTLMVLIYAFTLYQMFRLLLYLCARKLTGSWDARDKPQVQLVYYPVPEQWGVIRHGHKPLPLNS